MCLPAVDGGQAHSRRRYSRRLLLDGIKAVFEVREDVVDVFNAHGEADERRVDTDGFEFFDGGLGVRGGGGVYRQRAHVTNIDQQ